MSAVDVLAVDRCFACGRKIGKRATSMLVDTRDGQEVHVGADCFKRTADAGDAGYQPPKGGPRLYPLTHEGVLSVMQRCCGELGGDASEVLHQARAAVAELVDGDKAFLEVMQRFGSWNEGCFYYNGISAPELQSLIERKTAALARVGGGK